MAPVWDPKEAGRRRGEGNCARGGVRKWLLRCAFLSLSGELEVEKRIRKLNGWASRAPLTASGAGLGSSASIMATALAVYQVFHPSNKPMRIVILSEN